MLARRREFIAGLAGAAAWPLAARAQQRALPVIGLLMTTSREANLGRLAAFREGLNKTGYVEMRNVLITVFVLASLQGSALAQPAPPPDQQQPAYAPGELANAVQRFFGTVSHGLATVIENAVST
jgi:hypothetical protein